MAAMLLQRDFYSRQESSRGNLGQKIKVQNKVVVVMPKTVLCPISSSCQCHFYNPSLNFAGRKSKQHPATILGGLYAIKVHLSISEFIYLDHIVYFCCHMSENL